MNINPHTNDQHIIVTSENGKRNSLQGVVLINTKLWGRVQFNPVTRSNGITTAQGELYVNADKIIPVNVVMYPNGKYFVSRDYSQLSEYSFYYSPDTNRYYKIKEIATLGLFHGWGECGYMNYQCVTAKCINEALSSVGAFKIESYEVKDLESLF